MHSNFYTVVVLTAQEGKVDDLVAIMNELAAETRKEPGFVRYDFFKEQGDPRVIVSYEELRDAEAEAAHWQTDHLKGALGKFGTGARRPDCRFSRD